MPTQPDLSTPLARVDYAAHIFQNDHRLGYSHIFQTLSARGISEQEIEDGAALGLARAEAYRALRSRHGDPAYGGGREWNYTAKFDQHILERAADQGVSWCQPAPGVREMWQKAADVLRKYQEDTLAAQTVGMLDCLGGMAR